VRESVIVSAVRTPTGKFLGALKSFAATQLGACVVREAVRRAGVDPTIVDECIMGNVVAAGLGQNPARQAALNGGLPDHVAALTINKVCGSGLKAVMLADQAIRVGDIDVAVAGGMESMSNCPYLLPGAREGLRMGNGELVDSMIHDGLWCAFEQCHMGNAGEVVAERYKVGREAQDDYAAKSHQKAARATEPAAQAGAFQRLGIPVAGAITGEGKVEGGDVVWLDATTLAVGRGYRTNDEGIRQLRSILGDGIEVVAVPLPHWRGPQDVFHLMSILSPIDRDLALVYSPLLKRRGAPGNVAVAVVGGLPLFYGALAVGLPAAGLVPWVLAAWLHLARELVKDLGDEAGDRAAGRRTLPVRVGIARASRITAWASAAFFPLALVLPLATGYGGVYLAAASLSLVLLAIAIVALRRQRFVTASGLLKVAMLFGLGALVLGKVV